MQQSFSTPYPEQGMHLSGLMGQRQVLNRLKIKFFKQSTIWPSPIVIYILHTYDAVICL